MRAAIIGFGKQGQVHLEAMKSMGLEVVGICDSNSRAIPETLVATYLCYENWASMLREQKPELVSIATLSDTHTDAIIDAAESNSVKMIFCEKPISNSLLKAERAIQACHSRDILLAINHHRRCWPEHREIRRIVRSGKIGEIRSMFVSFGGARLGDNATHFIDWMRWMNGSRVTSVTGYLDDINEPNPRDPDGSRGFKDYPGTIDLQFGNGVRGRIEMRANVALPGFLFIEGTRGRVQIEEFKNHYDRWKIYARPEPNALVGTMDYYGRTEEIPFTATWPWNPVEFVAETFRLLMEGEVPSSGIDGIRALECLVAAHVSHEIGHSPVKLPLSAQMFYERVLKHA